MQVGNLEGCSSITVISPAAGADTDVSSVEKWLANAGNKAKVLGHLNSTGALLFRGFGVKSADDFQRVGLAVNPSLATRYPGGAPREKLAKHVWTASETPGKMPISSHCELSYIPKLRPDQILFCCLSEPTKGGETPVANMHQVWDSLPKDLQDRILANKFEVIRQYPESKRRMLDVRRLAGPTTAWPDVLGSTDPNVLQSDAQQDGVNLQFWKPGGAPPLLNLAEGKSAPLRMMLQLILTIVSPMLALMRALSPYPLVEMQEVLPQKHEKLDGVCVELVTSFDGSRQVSGRTAYAGIDVFFSEYGWAVEAVFIALRTRELIHAYIAFRICIGTIIFSAVRCMGLIGRAPLDLRMQGQALSLKDVVSIEKAYWNNFEYLKWQSGDVLILNNELCSHGRMPFEGNRRVLTAFG